MPVVLETTASPTADQLTATITNGSGTGFSLTGATVPSPIAGGRSYEGLDVVANTATPGSFSDTVTLATTDVNQTGYAAAISPARITLR